MTITGNTALLIVDVQHGFDEPYWGVRNNSDAEVNIANLLKAWRRTKRPVIHAQHMSVMSNSPLRPNQPGNAFKPEAMPIPGERIFQKKVNSAFIGTELEAYLHQNNISELVIVGITTDHCVSTTTRMAANLGFKAIVVADATATFDRIGPDGEHCSAEQIHRFALASLHGEFATICRSRDLLVDIDNPSAT